MGNPTEIWRCRNCFFWEENVLDTPQDWCRRFPPTGPAWAQTTGDDWCGEFRIDHCRVLPPTQPSSPE